ncbi:Cyclic di-GMP phosphodiesterase Gmr OS=Lysinibacillus sphaericus OX=1421 GN=gmr_1 PE=4 SV=1 [Lysinibacillus sphaericus]
MDTSVFCFPVDGELSTDSSILILFLFTIKNGILVCRLVLDVQHESERSCLFNITSFYLNMALQIGSLKYLFPTYRLVPKIGYG